MIEIPTLRESTKSGASAGQIEVLDLFSAAAGGWSLGMHRAGFTTIAACESEAWRRALYSENNPHVEMYDDVRTLTADRLLADLGRLPTVIVGSPPCQDISSANTKGKGVEGARSGLYFEAIRILGECRPRWFALENSPNLRTRGYDAVKAAVEAIGYACWPYVVRAGDIGANHERARAWVIGCDLEQIADADEGACNPFAGICNWESALDARGGVLAGCACDVADTACEGHAGRCPVRSGRQAGHQHAGGYDAGCPRPLGGAGNAAHADQAGQAHGCMEPSLRQAQIADDGCCAGRCNDGSRARKMGLRTADREPAFGSGLGWSLADLADHLRMDDGLSARLAGTRVAVSDGRGQSAASLIVEAFGDAVIPQIPEAIGRAIVRVEQAMAAVRGREAI